jgi:uncharacterized protein (DUF983 family)
MADYLKIAKEALAKYRTENPLPAGVRPYPRCPRCGSYYLYRKNGQGNYQCQSCELGNISEEVARRVQ